MADLNEFIRSFSVSDAPFDFVIRGGRIYVIRWNFGYLTVYHYGGEEIKDHLSIPQNSGIEVRNGRINFAHKVAGGDGIRICHYDGSSIRNMPLAYVPRFIRIKNGRYWIVENDLPYLHEHHYDGTEIRTYLTGDKYSAVEIRSGRLYILQRTGGDLRISNKAGEEIETREGDIRLISIRFRGGRVFAANYEANSIYIINYAYFNIP